MEKFDKDRDGKLNFEERRVAMASRPKPGGESLKGRIRNPKWKRKEERRQGKKGKGKKGEDKNKKTQA